MGAKARKLVEEGFRQKAVMRRLEVKLEALVAQTT
jgi:hypothetical protein